MQHTALREGSHRMFVDTVKLRGSGWLKSLCVQVGFFETSQLKGQVVPQLRGCNRKSTFPSEFIFGARDHQGAPVSGPEGPRCSIRA